MKKIYLVMTQTGSILSRTIKIVTGHSYNHISISLDSSLNNMYSFGRKNPDNPFIGVFVVEKINKGTFLKFKNTRCKVIEIDVTDRQYSLISSNINKMVLNKDDYKYNLLGLFLAAFHISFHPKKKFYCSEFVRYILKNSCVNVSFIPDIAHPNDFLKLKHVDLYEGLLREYRYNV